MIATEELYAVMDVCHISRRIRLFNILQQFGLNMRDGVHRIVPMTNSMRLGGVILAFLLHGFYSEGAKEVCPENIWGMQHISTI